MVGVLKDAPENPGGHPETRATARARDRWSVSVSRFFWVGAAGLVLAVGVALLARHAIDYPIMTFLSRSQGRSTLVEKLLLAPGRFDLLGGPIFIAGIWLVWFDAPRQETRARVIAGLLGSAAAGGVSRLLQLSLHSHPRPLHDSALSFTPPPWIDADALNHWNSFPSDHAALFFGLALTVFLERPRLGIAAFAWAVLVDLDRVYSGIHFPSDVVGGAALGLLFVCASQRRPIRLACGQIVRWAGRAPGPFYGCAFLLCYEVAELFGGIRDFGHAIGHLLHPS